jgi:hypothetical protein
MSISSVSTAVSMHPRAAAMRAAQPLTGGELARAGSRAGATEGASARREAAPEAPANADAGKRAAVNGSDGVVLTPAAEALMKKVAPGHLNSLGEGQALPDHVVDYLKQNLVIDQAEPGEGSPSAEPPMLTVQGLMAAWGQSESPYDLNGDGVVDLSDLLALLEAGGTMPMPDHGDTQTPALTVEGLMAAWGTSDPTFDLNGDGVVDTSDLMALLAQLGQGDGTTTNEPAMLTVGGLMEAWGQANSAYDLNGDGVVDTSDLLALLAAGGSMPAPEPDPELTIDGLLAAWGTNNPMYDLTGTGVVDVGDLLALLGMLNGGDQA